MPISHTSRNQLLASVPEAEFRRLAPKLKPIDLPLRHSIYLAGAAIDWVYFPNGGIASSVAYGGDGDSIEVATIGDEGVLGVTAVLDRASSPNEVYMQIAGDGLRISASVLRKEAGPGTSLYQAMVRYLEVHLFQVSQSVACNGLHKIRQRCCRWLLMTHDRVRTDELPLTHEFLGVMLGVRRASVSEVLNPLQKRGLIRCVRGKIMILDRAGLESGSCDCYRLVAEAFDRLYR